MGSLTFFPERMPRDLREKISPLRSLVGKEVVVHVHGKKQEPVRGHLIAVLPTRTSPHKIPAAQLALFERVGDMSLHRNRVILDSRLVEDAALYDAEMAKKPKPWFPGFT